MRLIRLALLVSSLALSWPCFSAPLAVAPAAAEAASSDAWEKQKYTQAMTLFRRGDARSIERASALLEEIHDRNASSPYVLAAGAEFQFQALVNGNRQVTIEGIRGLCKQISQLKPDMPDPYIVLARLELEAGIYDEARRYADEALRLGPGNPEAFFAKARVEMAWRNFAESERWFLKAIDAASDPIRKSDLYSNLTELYGKQEPPAVDRLIDAQKRAADLAPRNAWKRSGLAFQLNLYTDRHDEAIAAARQSLRCQDHDQGREQLAIALYAKWAAAYLDGTLQSGRTKVPAPAAIAKETGYAPERMFINGASRKAGVRIATAMLKAKVIKDIDVVPPGGCCTALIAAAQAQNLELLQMLAEHGANINATNSGYTALTELALAGNIKGMDLLLAKGARRNVVDANNVPLTQLLANANNPNATRALIRLLQAGADPDLPSPDGAPLLIVAVRRNNTELLKALLVDVKVDPDVRDSKGNSALAWAASSFERTAPAHVKLLLDAGASPWVKYWNRDLLQSVEQTLGIKGLSRPEVAQIADLLREARKRVPKPAGYELAKAANG